MFFQPRIGLLFCSLLLLSMTSYSQQAEPVASTQGSRISFDVVVTPQSGVPVQGLQQQDFTVLDNKAVRPIASFKPVAGPDAPVEVILVIDAVNAEYQTVAYAKDKIDKFLMADGGELAHPLTLAVVTDQGTQIQQGSSRDGKAVKTALDDYAIRLRTVRRSAGFYGAEERLDISLQALNGLIVRESVKPGRKLIIWVSPGWPLISGPGVQLTGKQEDRLFRQIASLSTQLREARITLYSVDPIGSNESIFRTSYYKEFLNGVSKPGQTEPGDLGLQVLATQTGGLAMTSNNDIAGMLQRAVNDSKAYYEISFDAAPGEQVDEYHKVEVQVNKAGLTARTRTGYYAEPADSGERAALPRAR